METVTSSNTLNNAAPSTQTKAFCCCGLSRTFPICDGSQKIAKTQRAERLFNCGAVASATPEMHHLETT
jgi:CDGSH-type Zn-finger protein